MFARIKTLQFVITMIGLLGVVWFLIPLILHRILNIGNGTGIFIFLCVFVYGIKMQKINVWIINTSEKKVGKILLGIAGVTIAITIMIVMFFSFCMIKASNEKPSENSTVIVLGCRVYGEQASLMLVERLEAAYEYLVVNNDTICIISGGQGEGEDISEAECMYRYLSKKGINPQRLYKEEKSTSTRENLAFSKEIIEKNNLNSDVAIVTNEFHEYRARRVAKNLNLNSTAISGKTAWWLFPTYYVRELYGIIYEVFL